MKDQTITRAQAVLVLTEIGFQTSDKWDDAKINKKLATLHELTDFEDECAKMEKSGAKDALAVFKTVIETTTGGATVTLAAGDKPELKEVPPAAEKKEDKAEAEEKPKAEKKKDAGKKAEAAVKESAKKKPAPAPAAKPKPTAKGKGTYIEQVKNRTLREGSQLQIIDAIFKGQKSALTVDEVVAAAKKKGKKVTEARARGAIWILQKRGDVVAGKEEGTFKQA